MIIKMTLLIEIANLTKEDFDAYKEEANNPSIWQQAVGDDNMKVLRVSCTEAETTTEQTE